MKKLIGLASLVFALSAQAEPAEDFWSGALLASNTVGNEQLWVDRGNQPVPSDMVERTLDSTLGEVSRSLDWELDFKVEFDPTVAR